MATVLCFMFFNILEESDITTSLRVSLWLEKNSNYLMPCEFKEILKESNFFNVKIVVLDPNEFISKKYLDKKFLFGHPGKIIGYGILRGIEE